MNVICIKPTSKLIKGATYKVVNFNNINSKGYSFFRPIIRIYLNESTIETFSLSNFKPTVGDDFPQTNWICPDYQILLNERDQMKIDKNLKSGDYVVPMHDNLKTLVKGRKYKVTDVKIHDEKTSAGVVRWSTITIKLEGSHRYYISHNFRKCTSQEVREIGLSQIFDETINTESVNKFKRKFDYYTDDEKKKLLFKFIIESANDRFRNQMDIIDWATTKTGSKFKLNKEDFDLVKDSSLSELLEYLK